MRNSSFSVSFTHVAGNSVVSRVGVTTKRAALSWAAWLAKQSYVADVAVHRGEVGADLIERQTVRPVVGPSYWDEVAA